MNRFKHAFLIVLFALFSIDASSQSLENYLDLTNEVFEADKAFGTTKYVAQYWRLAGNPGFDSSIFHVEKILRSAGYVNESQDPEARLTYRIEKYPLSKPAWEPIDAKLFIEGEKTPVLSFETNRNMLAINSFSTSKKGVAGELVYLEDCSEESLAAQNLKGKIVLAECSTGRLFAAAVKKYGALGVLTYGVPFYNQPEEHKNSISFGGISYEPELKSWGIKLSLAAKERLQKKLEAGPVKVRVKVEAQFIESDELTILAEVKGSERPEERFVFSAHVQEPGANDNASGVGAQAEMARTAAKLLQAGSINPARTLTFLWGDEIRSTRRYITQDKERAEKIKWGMSLDMVGEDTEKTGGTFLIEKMPDPSAIWTRGDDKHSEWGASEVFEQQFNPHYFNDFIEYVCRMQGKRANWIVNTNPFEGGSDHQPFLDAKIPGLLLWHFTDVYYHTDGDRIDKVSPQTLKNVGVSALSSALFLCSGKKTSAKEILDLTEQAGLKRLQREMILSAQAIKKGSPVVEEREILWAWGYWYGRALPKVSDILLEEPSADFEQELNEALKRIGKQTIDAMRSLE